MKKAVVIAVLVIVAVVLAGFLFLPKSQQQSPQDETEQIAQKNYIELKGGEGIIRGKISPTNGTKVKGIIEVSLTKVPEKTDIVNFAMIPAGRELGGQDLRADSDGSDGFSILFDTNAEVNGLYEITVLAEYIGRPDSEGPLDFAQAQIIIEN